MTYDALLAQRIDHNQKTGKIYNMEVAILKLLDYVKSYSSISELANVLGTKRQNIYYHIRDTPYNKGLVTRGLVKTRYKKNNTCTISITAAGKRHLKKLKVVK